ncbi:ABC transporter permease, partial [Anoxybacillus flavithermus]|nr:ABC transporter permease [Anoxybacillus flavithermus]
MSKMLSHQVKVELMGAVTWRQCVIWAALILVLPTIQFLLIKENYVYYRQLDLFLRLNSNFVPLFFPIIMVLVYAIYFVGEQKNYFIPYVRI